jgi:hypothetical protein
MPFVEIIFETGNSSIAYYETDKEMQNALAEHHRRAVNGEPGTGESKLRADLPSNETRIGSWVAERVKKVLTYDEHPATYGEDQLATAADVQEAVAAAIDEHGMNGLVGVHAVAAAVRDMSNPLVAEPGVHDSRYKAKENAEVDLGFLKAVEN